MFYKYFMTTNIVICCKSNKKNYMYIEQKLVPKMTYYKQIKKV